MPQQIPLSHSMKQGPRIVQEPPKIAGPRASANKHLKIESKSEPGARYQFLTASGEFKTDHVATYEQIHGHMGLGCPDEQGRHTGMDVADLIKRGIVEQVPAETPLTDEGREPALNPDAMEKYRDRQAEKAKERIARDIILKNDPMFMNVLREQAAKEGVKEKESTPVHAPQAQSGQRR